MRLEYQLNPRKTAILLGIVSLYLAIQSLFTEYLLENVLINESEGLLLSFIDLFSVNAEETIPTWYATILLFFAAVLLAFIASAKRKKQDPFRHHWLGLAVIFLYLSMDEGAVIHEIFSNPLRELFNTSGYLTFAWLLVFVPLLLIFALVYLRFLFHLPTRSRNLFILAGVLYVGGAVVVESISANQWSINGGANFFYLAIATVEELLEMLGVVLFIFALLSYIILLRYTAVFNTDTPLQPAPTIRPSKAKLRVIATAVILIIGLNVALYSWAINQPSAQGTVDLQDIPFYQTMADQYAGQGVIIIGINERFTPDNSAAAPIAESLLTLFNEVIVVTLPTSGTSIVFASQYLPFTPDELSEIVQQSGETEFVLLTVSDLRTLAENKPTDPYP